MPTQIALDKADPAIADVVEMLKEGEPISMSITAVPGSLEGDTVVMDVTDINLEEAGGMENESEATKSAPLMPETQLKEGGFDTGPVAPKKRNKGTQSPNQPHQ